MLCGLLRSIQKGPRFGLKGRPVESYSRHKRHNVKKKRDQHVCAVEDMAVEPCSHMSLQKNTPVSSSWRHERGTWNNER